MQTGLRSHRKAWGISLDDLSRVLGSGFSRARLSIAERGLIELTESERQVILEGIERLGILHAQIRRDSDVAQKHGLIGVRADLQRRTAALARGRHKT